MVNWFLMMVCDEIVGLVVKIGRGIVEDEGLMKIVILGKIWQHNSMIWACEE